MTAPVPEEKKVTYNFLGRSGIKVSNICFGCATFSYDAGDEDTAHAILNRYVEWGGNFLDTADIYSCGQSETQVGKWLERQPRDKFVIATKCRGNMGTEENINNVGLSRRHITESIDRSLQRLHTDFVDLYQIHSVDDGTPIDETLRTLDDLVRVGKIRYIGTSNMTGWQLQRFVAATQQYGLNSIISLQQQYNLTSRISELEVFQVCKTFGIGVLPWSPLKGGVLAGKIKRGERPKEGRLYAVASRTQQESEASPDWNKLDQKTFDIIETLRAIAEKKERSMAQVAVRWLLQKDIVCSVIIGATALYQLEDNMAAANGWSLSADEMQELDDVSAPARPYPYNMVFSLNASRVNPAAHNFYVKSQGH